MDIVSEEKDLAIHAGEHLSTLLKDADTSPTLLLLSGGSALEILTYTILQGRTENLTVMIVDERFDKNPEENNFSRIQKTNFYERATKAGTHFINTSWGTAESVEALGILMDSALKSWVSEHSRGVIYMTLGIGTDGHTAGIMPFPEDHQKFNTLFNDQTTLAVGYDASGKNPIPLRATITFPFMRFAKATIVYAVGANKKEPLLKALSSDGVLAETPARIFNELENLTLYRSPAN